MENLANVKKVILLAVENEEREEGADPEIVELLLGRNGDPEIVDCDGKSALHRALQHEKPNEQIIKMLLDHGCDPNLPDKYYQMTPFHSACMNENRNILFLNHLILFAENLRTVPESVFKMLVAKGANPKLKDSKGMDGMELATDMENKTALKFLKGHK